MTRDIVPANRSASRQHLVCLLAEQFERTFTTEGHEQALRAYAYQHGIRSEDELEEKAGPGGGTTGAGSE